LWAFHTIQPYSHYSGLVITGSIARSATRRYLIYSEADFEVLRPAGATRCTDGGKFGMEEGTASMPNFTPFGATARVQDPKNRNFFTEI